MANPDSTTTETAPAPAPATQQETPPLTLEEAALKGAFARALLNVDLKRGNEREAAFARLSKSLEEGKSPEKIYRQGDIRVNLEKADSETVTRIGTEVLKDVLKPDDKGGVKIDKEALTDLLKSTGDDVKRLHEESKGVTSETPAPDGPNAALPVCPPGLKAPGLCR